MKKGFVNGLLFLTVIIALTFNFKKNLYQSAADSFFDWFQMDGESLVVGRLLLNDKNGFADQAGFLGWTHPEPDAASKFWFQYDAYQKGLDFASFEGYHSHPGGQAFVFSVICKITGWHGEVALERFRWMVSFFTALAFALFLYWVLLNWGPATTVGVFVLIIFSQWITVHGRNLFWVLSAFYVPFLTALFWLHRCEKKGADCKSVQTEKGTDCKSMRTGKVLITFLLMSVSFFIKFLFTGFEYVTTAMVMAVVPWVFYAIDRQWDVKKTVRSAMAACCGVLAAVVAGVLWLSAQHAVLKGSFKDGLEYILWSFGKRAHGLPQYDYGAYFEQKIQSGQWEVIAKYSVNHAFHVRHWFNSPVWQYVSVINFAFCILFFIVMSYVSLALKTIRKDTAFHRRQKALVWTLWASLLAPLSWFVIFKGHAADHLHMAPIVWYMPFMLFGFVLTCSTLYKLLFTNHSTG